VQALLDAEIEPLADIYDKIASALDSFCCRHLKDDRAVSAVELRSRTSYVFTFKSSSWCTLQSSSEMKLVSVVIPMFNRSAFIDRAIDSVLGQTYPNVDVIVVYVGSPDNTVARVRNRSKSGQA